MYYICGWSVQRESFRGCVAHAVCHGHAPHYADQSLSRSSSTLRVLLPRFHFFSYFYATIPLISQWLTHVKRPLLKPKRPRVFPGDDQQSRNPGRRLRTPANLAVQAQTQLPYLRVQGLHIVVQTRPMVSVTPWTLARTRHCKHKCKCRKRKRKRHKHKCWHCKCKRHRRKMFTWMCSSWQLHLSQMQSLKCCRALKVPEIGKRSTGQL